MRKEERKKLTASLVALLISTGCFAQPSATARRMAQQGMVDILSLDSTFHVSLMYSRADNFTGKILYTDLREALLHPKAAAALVKAQRLLKERRPELSLKVYDATRPMSVQQKMWNVVAGTKKSIYVSNPKNGGGMHNYGLAVDITLCRAATGDTLDMGTKIDFLGSYAHIDDEAGLVGRHIITEEAKQNRELLRQVMTEAGFKPLRTEWWFDQPPQNNNNSQFGQQNQNDNPFDQPPQNNNNSQFGQENQNDNPFEQKPNNSQFGQQNQNDNPYGSQVGQPSSSINNNNNIDNPFEQPPNNNNSQLGKSDINNNNDNPYGSTINNSKMGESKIINEQNNNNNQDYPYKNIDSGLSNAPQRSNYSTDNIPFETPNNPYASLRNNPKESQIKPKEEEANTNPYLSESNNKVAESQFNLFNQAETKEIKEVNTDDNPYGDNNDNLEMNNPFGEGFNKSISKSITNPYADNNNSKLEVQNSQNNNIQNSMQGSIIDDVKFKSSIPAFKDNDDDNNDFPKSE